MKNPPSASVNPPTQTTQRVPMRSSKPGPGCGSGGGVAAVAPSASFGAASWLSAAGATASACSAAMRGDAAAWVCSSPSNAVSGGGPGRACSPVASIASSRARSMSALLKALRAKINATTAISSAKKSNGESNIKPPGDRSELKDLSHQIVIAVRPSAPPAYAQAGRRPLLQHLAAKSKQRGGPPAGLCRHHPGWFDQGAGFYQPAEILLVQMPPRNRFHGVLQFSECEFGWQKFKYHGAVFQFGAQPSHRGGQNSPVVEVHRCAEGGKRPARQCRRASVPSRLLDQSCLIEYFVTIEHALLVPMRALGAEIKPDAILAAERACRLRWLALSRPARQLWKDVALDHGGTRFPPVFPWEKPVPGLERRARRGRGVVGRARQRKIADRGDMRVGVAGLRMSAAIAEGIELLDIAEPQARLLFHPGAQPNLEGAVRDRVERPERKPGEFVAVAAGCGEDQRLVAFDRDDGGGQADFDRRQRPVAHLASVKGITRDRCGTAGLRPACCQVPSRRARAASAPRAPAPCPPGRQS